ncbi:MAG: PfkB family carbohydrate kinase, partial [Dehalococcoidia bacterium]|nr:PfkB family carbohydrate kinase [Dehalococcoidia bacterium]
LDSGAAALLLQMELPLTLSLKTAEYARSKNKVVVMDPAPAGFMPIDAYQFFDYLIPNETEAESLVGHPVETNEEVMNAAKTLFDRGVNRGVIIKLGGRGAFYINQETSGFVPAPEVAVIDTVAAGDAFNAGFTAYLLQGESFEKSVEMGVLTGSLAVTKLGAQESMPSLEDIEKFLKTI